MKAISHDSSLSVHPVGGVAKQRGSVTALRGNKVVVAKASGGGRGNEDPEPALVWVRPARGNPNAVKLQGLVDHESELGHIEPVKDPNLVAKKPRVAEGSARLPGQDELLQFLARDVLGVSVVVADTEKRRLKMHHPPKVAEPRPVGEEVYAHAGPAARHVDAHSDGPDDGCARIQATLRRFLGGEEGLGWVDRGGPA